MYIGLYANIIDEYFNGFKINNKTISFSLIIQEFVRHLIGQVTTLIFDNSKNYNVISITKIYNDMVKNNICSSNYKKLSKKVNKLDSISDIQELERLNNIHKKFHDAEIVLDEIIKEYREPLKYYRDKSYAHHESISSESLNNEKKELKIKWEEFRILLSRSKSIIESMALFWKDESSDFMHNQYDEFRKKFWDMIKV